jgi:hypothetical protein
MATSPYIHPLLYQSIILSNGMTSPGKVRLSGHDQKEKWERQAPKGTSGEVSVNHGRELVEITATFELADDEDIDGWTDFAKFLYSLTSAGGNGKAKAIGVYHPDLVSGGITDCVVTSLGGLTHDDKGMSHVIVKFLEYRPPKPKAASKAVAGPRQGTTTLDPNAAAKRELQLLLEQAKKPL